MNLSTMLCSQCALPMYLIFLFLEEHFQGFSCSRANREKKIRHDPLTLEFFLGFFPIILSGSAHQHRYWKKNFGRKFMTRSVGQKIFVTDTIHVIRRYIIKNYVLYVRVIECVENCKKRSDISVEYANENDTSKKLQF